MKRSAVLLLTPFVFIAFLRFAVPYWWFHPSPDIMSSTSLPDSSWVIEDRVGGHVSAMNGGYSEIVAKNKKTNEEITIIVFKEATDTTISLGQPHQVIITAPLAADVVQKIDMFDGISVVYNFISDDDPQWQKIDPFRSHKKNASQTHDWHF